MITAAITNCLKNAQQRGWDKTYWAFDIHGTLLKPTYQKGVVSTEFYPFAKEAMQLLSSRDEIVKILFTCSYPNEITEYVRFFAQHGILFNHINANPEVCAGAYGHYESKFYFNLLFEDKAGFDPTTEWEKIYVLLKQMNY